MISECTQSSRNDFIHASRAILQLLLMMQPGFEIKYLDSFQLSLDSDPIHFSEAQRIEEDCQISKSVCVIT